MAEVIDAIYENGVLRPLQELDLSNHQRVRINIEVNSPAHEDEKEARGDPLEGLSAATGLRDLAEHFDAYRFGRRLP